MALNFTFKKSSSGLSDSHDKPRADNEFSKAIFDELSETKDQNIIPISAEKAVSGGVYSENGLLIDDTEGQMVTICDLKEIRCLPGVHNWQNAAAAYAACKAAGIERV